MREERKIHVLHSVQPEAVHPGLVPIPFAPAVQLGHHFGVAHVQVCPHQVIVVAVFAYQQVLLTQLQNNDKRIEEIKKEQEEIQNMFLQESKFKPGDLVQVDYKISNATFKVRGWIFRITFWRNRPYYHLNLPKKDGSRGLRVKSICDGVLESITSISHIKLEDLKGGAK